MCIKCGTGTPPTWVIFQMRAVESPLPDASRSCFGFQAQINTLKTKKVPLNKRKFRQEINQLSNYVLFWQNLRVTRVLIFVGREGWLSWTEKGGYVGSSSSSLGFESRQKRSLKKHPMKTLRRRWKWPTHTDPKRNIYFGKLTSLSCPFSTCAFPKGISTPLST